MNYTAINWKKSALILIDMQYDFADPKGAAPIAGTAAIVPELARLTHLFRHHQRPVIHVIRLYHEDGSNVDNCRRELIEGGKKIAAVNSPGAGIIAELLPEAPKQPDHSALLSGSILQTGNQDHVLYKPRWGAFYGTSLENFLLAQNMDSVIIAGCNFPNCPRTTIYEASERNFRIGIVRGTISGIYEKGVDELKGIGVEILVLEDLDRLLKQDSV